MDRHDALELITAVKFDLALVDLGLPDGSGVDVVTKLRDADTNQVLFTNIACKQLDLRSCQCKDYKNRKSIVPDCVQLSPRNIGRIDWLPETCAYKLVHRGQDLPWWHPLISGDPRTGDGLSLSPSIFHTTAHGGCGWHGYLTNGVLRPC